MKDLNHVSVIGRLIRDAELKDGRCSFSIAFNNTKKEGDKWIDDPSFLNLMLFGHLAETLFPRLGKGTQVAISGHLKQNRWESNGQKMSALNVVVDEIQIVGSGKSDSSSNFKPCPSNNEPVDAGTPFDDFGF